MKAYAKFFAGSPPGSALDVAGGAGRHALWLAQRGWRVRLIDISEAGVALARKNAARLLPPGPRGELLFQAAVADLNASADLGHEQYDLVLVFFYLQRQLFPALIRALKPGGLLIYQTYTTEQRRLKGGPSNPAHLLQPNELRQAFESLRVLHYRESALGRAAAELIAQKPALADRSGRAISRQRTRKPQSKSNRR